MEYYSRLNLPVGKYVQYGDWTMNESGAKNIPLTGLHDKREITALFAAVADGTFYHLKRYMVVHIHRMWSFLVTGTSPTMNIIGPTKLQC